MSIGYYVGQARKARELAIKELGAEKVACMSDSEIADWIDGGFAIFWGDVQDEPIGHKPDDELIALIPNDAFHEIRDSIVWLER